MLKSPSSDATQGDVSYHSQRLPAVLRPNRGPRVIQLLLLLGVFGFVAYQVILTHSKVFTLDLPVNVDLGTWAQGLMPELVLGLILVVCAFSAWREFAYFRSHGSYFLGLSSDGLTMSKPFGRRSFSWQDIERFRVEVGRESRKSGTKQVFTVRSGVKDGGWFRGAIALPQADFADKLGPDKAASAEILCSFLNEVRDLVREAKRMKEDVVVQVPYGLLVIEAPGATYGGTKRPVGVTQRPISRAATKQKPVVRKPTVSRE